MTRYKLVLGMTIPTLEMEINQMVSDEPSAKLINAFYVPGAGFLGAMEYEGDAAPLASAPATKKTGASATHRKTKGRKS